MVLEAELEPQHLLPRAAEAGEEEGHHSRCDSFNQPGPETILIDEPGRDFGLRRFRR